MWNIHVDGNILSIYELWKYEDTLMKNNFFMLINLLMTFLVAKLLNKDMEALLSLPVEEEQPLEISKSDISSVPGQAQLCKSGGWWRL